MKYRILVVGTNLMLLLVFAVGIWNIQNTNYVSFSIADLNHRFKTTQEELEGGKSAAEAEEENDCTILYFGQEDYYGRLNEMLVNGAVAFDYMDGDRLVAKILFEKDEDEIIKAREKLVTTLVILFGVLEVLVNGLMLYLYYRIMYPFHRLQKFAGKIAIGDFEDPLVMEGNNYFGAFTESFDVMREELRRAREGEYQANISKRELVAGLSHDIKTPVATIKALCEILEVRLGEGDERNKIITIDQKATVIDNLISNMFQATLEELQTLKIQNTEERSQIIMDMLQDLNYYDKIRFLNTIPGCLIQCDPLRMNQVIDNIISNSYKYADTPIEVSFGEREQYLEVRIRDFGKSLSTSELDLICQKFYRGENAAGKTGSGLGLYLARLFMQGMGGELNCSQDEGFIVTLMIRKV